MRRVAIVMTGVAILIVPPAARVTAGVAVPEGMAAPLTIVSQPFSVVGSSTSRFVIDAPPQATVDPRDRLTFEVHRRVASRSSLSAIIDGSANAAVIDSVSFPLSAVPRDTAGDLAPYVPIVENINNAVSLRLPLEGVYPLTIRINDDRTGNLITSIMTFIDKRKSSPATRSVEVSTYARLVTPPSLTPDGQVVVSDYFRAKTRAFIQYLKDNPRPMTISVQPETVAALGSSTDPADVSLFASLRDELRKRAIVTSTFAHVDVSTLASLGLNDEFIDQLRLGENTLNRFLPGVRIQRNTWVSDTPLTKQGVALLRKAGMSALIILPPAQEGLETRAPLGLVARPDGRSNEFMSVVAADARAAALLGGQQNTSIDVARAAAASMVMERDDLIAAGRDPSSLHLLLSTVSGDLDTTALGVTTRALADAPGMSVRDFSSPQMVTASSPVIVFGARAAATDPTLANRLVAARRELDSVSSMVTDADVSLETWTHLLGVGISDSSDAPSYIAGLRATLRDVRSAVSVTTPDKISLSGHSASIRLQIRNNSKQELTVRVRLYSPKLNLTEPNRVVKLTANGTTDVVIPATTRTNGQFPISLRLSTPEGNLEVVPYMTITARVTALAGLGQLVSISLLLVLLAWWWSHWRRARSAPV